MPENPYQPPKEVEQEASPLVAGVHPYESVLLLVVGVAIAVGWALFVMLDR